MKGHLKGGERLEAPRQVQDLPCAPDGTFSSTDTLILPAAPEPLSAKCQRGTAHAARRTHVARLFGG